MASSRPSVALLLSFFSIISVGAFGDNTNHVYSPCGDVTVQRSDGFTFGIASAARTTFFSNNYQLSPCDSRLSLSSANSQVAVFRPKVDEISLLTINTSNFSTESYGGYMVAFAGRRHGARFMNLKRGGCKTCSGKDGRASCSGRSNFVCLNNQDCAIRTSNCRNHGGLVDCILGIQLAFSGTDKHESVFNSWYEVKNLRKYSLSGLYSNLRDPLTSQYNRFF